MKGCILIVDDEPLKRVTLQIELSEAGYEVLEAQDAATARRIFDSRPVDVVLADLRLPAMDGLDLLSHVKQVHPGVAVILMTACATVDSAVLAIKRGAFDYVTKPFATHELLTRVERALASRETPPAANAAAEERFGKLVTRSHSMKRLFGQLRAVADSERTILLCGETGTGKELLAEAVHDASRRAAKPLVRFSCAALQPSVLESELFGHEKGAFTNAIRQKPGRFELAHAGTMLLDEVDDIPLELQVKLLRVLEQQEFERVGGEAPVKVDVRLVCATKRDLLALVRQGQFREDLYYRLNVISVSIPPLRDRPEDIPVLARHFVEKHAALAAHRAGNGRIRISPHALEELTRHAWPGNVRELEHVVERALAFCDGEIRPEHILPLAGPSQSNQVLAQAELEMPFPELREVGTLGLNETIADIEKRMILMALRQCNHNQARAAAHLRIPRTTLRDKMAKYSIPSA